MKILSQKPILVDNYYVFKRCIGFRVIYIAFVYGLPRKIVLPCELASKLSLWLELFQYFLRKFFHYGKDRAAVIPKKLEVVGGVERSEEHTSELQSRPHLVC